MSMTAFALLLCLLTSGQASEVCAEGGTCSDQGLGDEVGDVTGFIQAKVHMTTESQGACWTLSGSKARKACKYKHQCCDWAALFTQADKYGGFCDALIEANICPTNPCPTGGIPQSDYLKKCPRWCQKKICKDIVCTVTLGHSDCCPETTTAAPTTPPSTTPTPEPCEDPSEACLVWQRACLCKK
eukprot:TRINITY_DN1042_c2_g1_i1.p1 TRINITY_DN1042_c2_g1~~TRINITY_DN1042_c2_g1_i1.p1  ORF type:complete len:211 (+),score=34.21 TRINITY_DN1042_c2_g1_i1:79-633(+)